MASDARNIRLGTCRVLFNGNDLGLTLGGVEVTVETTTYESKVDQFGESIVNEYITGRTIAVTVPMAETTLENLALIMPGATLITDGEKKKVEVTSGIGASLLDQAGELTLHPIALPDADSSEDLVIPKAATPGGISFSYAIDSERVYNANFKGYPDMNNGNLLFIYGDEAAVAP